MYLKIVTILEISAIANRGGDSKQYKRDITTWDTKISVSVDAIFYVERHILEKETKVWSSVHLISAQTWFHKCVAFVPISHI